MASAGGGVVSRGVAKRSAGWLAGWALALVLAAVMAMLGNWQAGRAVQKERLLQAAGEVLEAREPRPLALAADPSRADRLDWAAGSGRFVDAPAILLDNQLRDGRPGVRAYRLFDAGAPEWILVELGWLAMPGDRSLPRVDRPDGEFELGGLLAPPPSAGLALGEALAPRGEALLAMRLDLDALEREVSHPVAPRVLRLDPALPLGFERDLDLLPNTLTPDRHRGYALQWYGLAATVLVIAALLTVRALRRTRRNPK